MKIVSAVLWIRIFTCWTKWHYFFGRLCLHCIFHCRTYVNFVCKNKPVPLCTAWLCCVAALRFWSHVRSWHSVWYGTRSRLARSCCRIRKCWHFPWFSEMSASNPCVAYGSSASCSTYFRSFLVCGFIAQNVRCHGNKCFSQTLFCCLHLLTIMCVQKCWSLEKFCKTCNVLVRANIVKPKTPIFSVLDRLLRHQCSVHHRYDNISLSTIILGGKNRVLILGNEETHELTQKQVSRRNKNTQLQTITMVSCAIL